MKDFSRMFETQTAAVVEGKKKMPDYSNMFGNQPSKAVAGNSPQKSPFSNSTEILEWRRDLSDKVKEHIDLVEKLVHSDCNMIALAEQKLHELSEEVMDEVEKKSSKSFLSSLFKSKEPTVDMVAKVKSTMDQIDMDLRSSIRPDPFKLMEVDRMVEQALYLAEQLAKAGDELDKMKSRCSDDIEIDSINRRCATLFKQQQLVAIGADEVKKLAANIRSRPHQIDDMLHATIPMYRKLCLDVLSGAAQANELRNAL